MSLAHEYVEYQKLVLEKGIIFSYGGIVSESVLYSMGEALKQKMTMEETNTNTIKRVFSVFVEQVQNIIRYSAERDGPPHMPLSSGIVTVGREEDGFFVVCANMVTPEAANELKTRLQDLEGMDPQELKAYYRQKLREPQDQDAVGAGLGLLEIARRASAPVEYDLMDFGADRTFFCLKAYI